MLRLREPGFSFEPAAIRRDPRTQLRVQDERDCAGGRVLRKHLARAGRGVGYRQVRRIDGRKRNPVCQPG